MKSRAKELILSVVLFVGPGGAKLKEMIFHSPELSVLHHKVKGLIRSFEPASDFAEIELEFVSEVLNETHQTQKIEMGLYLRKIRGLFTLPQAYFDCSALLNQAAPLRKAFFDEKNRLQKRHVGLWRQNCLELFWGKAGSSRYYEFNLGLDPATFGFWNIFEFDTYRTPTELRETQAFALKGYGIELASLPQSEKVPMPQVKICFQIEALSHHAPDAGPQKVDPQAREEHPEQEPSNYEVNPTLVWGSPQKFYASDHPRSLGGPDFHQRESWLLLEAFSR